MDIIIVISLNVDKSRYGLYLAYEGEDRTAGESLAYMDHSLLAKLTVERTSSSILWV